MYDILKDTMYVHDPSKTVLTLFRFQSSFAPDIKLNWNFTSENVLLKLLFGQIEVALNSSDEGV